VTIDLGSAPGARFLRDGETVLFAFVLDTANIVGPREATEEDKAEHPQAWAEFLAAEDRHPLDGDAEDGKGGSLPRRGGRRKKVTHESADDHSGGH
jgi:hypothetical protein